MNKINATTCREKKRKIKMQNNTENNIKNMKTEQKQKYNESKEMQKYKYISAFFHIIEIKKNKDSFTYFMLQLNVVFLENVLFLLSQRR